MCEYAMPLILARVNGTYGVKGWVKIASFTRPKENIFQYSSLLINVAGEWRTAEIEKKEKRGTRYLIKFIGVETPEAAQQFVGANLGIEKEALPDLPKGEYYWHQLIGLEVVDQNEELLGKVKEIVETGANDVLVVKSALKERPKLLIPLIIGHYVTSVDLEHGRLTVDWQQGE